MESDPSTDYVTGESVISRENVAVNRSIRTEEEHKIGSNKGSIIWKSSGGWKAASILLANQCLATLAFFGVGVNLVLFLTRVLGQSNADAANSVSKWTGTVYLCSLIGAFLSDSYWGRYLTCAVFQLIFVSGLALVSVSSCYFLIKPDGCGDGELACEPTSSVGVAIFYLSIYLVAFGYGGHQPSLATFGADQFDESKPKEKSYKAAYFCYFYFALNFGSLFSNTILVYFEDHGKWTLGFLVSLGSAVLALLRNGMLPPAKADELYEVEGPESAIKGSRKILHSDDLIIHIYFSSGSDYEVVILSRQSHIGIRFLDKAATVTEDDLILTGFDFVIYLFCANWYTPINIDDSHEEIGLEKQEDDALARLAAGLVRFAFVSSPVDPEFRRVCSVCGGCWGIWGFVSAALLVFLPDQFKSGGTMGQFITEQIILYIGSFSVFLCWELSHHLHQVLHTKRYLFAPPKGSAAAETNPTEPLLAALEESIPDSLPQYLAYLDLCMVCENNVDAWRRAAFFEETGETYKKVVAACLRPLEQLTSNLREVLEGCYVGKAHQLSNQLQSPTDSQLDSKHYESLNNFQKYAWSAKAVAFLTERSHEEDRFGVAQLTGSNAAVLSTLISSLLAIEVFMGKKTSLQPQHLMGPVTIKWNTPSTGRRDVATANKRGGPLDAKTCAMADVLSNSIYSIVSAFHDEMLTSTKAGLLEKDWVTKTKPFFGTYELLVQKLRHFLDFRAS
ncbi:hypothetical protein D5086_007681 [Populus alba]|uniref:Uncharacterized protein n=1 Tax=Populus alba TaxID=43335 RepID=A0ACC4CRB2_POPAL